MKSAQACWHTLPTPQDAESLRAIQPQLAWVFADVKWLSDPACLPALQAALPGVTLMGCSTAGEITNEGVENGAIVVTAVHFEHPDFKLVTTHIDGMSDSHDAGRRLAHALPQEGLRNVLVLGQGVHINGSALIEGMRVVLGDDIPLSGGLAGDAGQFQRTWTVSSDGISDKQLIALGLYGPHLQLRHGTCHGWQPFGVMRRVTRCEGNVLYELDDEPALDIYKRYLGSYAKDLPASGLLFPFEMLGEDLHSMGLIRTILGVDESQGSLILAGDIVPNGYLRLMHATTDSLINGAQAAAELAREEGLPAVPSLALLVSCVGRKLVMGAHVDEEIEAVADIFSQHATVCGFYSNGEISPLVKGLDCKLHNQTMTITYFYEVL